MKSQGNDRANMRPRGLNGWPRRVLCLLLCGASFRGAGEPLAFRTDVLPILTKAGCNSGACHGAATGQGGFKLSLLGYDPEEDYARITRELGGRRIDRVDPSASLLLRKPSRQVDHEGGRRLPRDSEGYANVLRWIKSGASYGPRDLRVIGISVSPTDTLLQETNQSFALQVRATLSDGTERDATALALYSSNDDALAEVDKEGKVQACGRGLTSIMVRYGGQVAAARVAVPFANTVFASFPTRNFIDAHIGSELRRLGLPASPLSTATEFLRRAHLDLTGRLPAPEEVRSYLAQEDTPGARERVVDELMARPEFADLWTLHWADLLLIGHKRAGAKPSEVYQGWLRNQVDHNTPFDQLVRSLLTAEGNVLRNPPANYFSLAADPRDLAEQTGRIFLGTRIGCARCHAHPADRWTQDDYYQFAAYFARVEREGDIIRPGARGEIEHPKTGRPVTPRPLGGGAVAGSADRRVDLARWITDRNNPMLARALANRVWKNFFGRGLVEPVDDLRPTNPATHPALLEALAMEFVASGFDARHLIRLIVSSRTYQLSSRQVAGNERDDRFYSHAYLRELPAQVYLDAVAQVTGKPETFEGYERGTHAVQLVGTRTASYALDVLGRCGRETSCDGSAQLGGGMALALHLINGPTLNDKLPGSVARELCEGGWTDRVIIEKLYMRALGRSPRPVEWTEWAPFLASAVVKEQSVQDLLWALLNCREFAYNH